MDPNSKHNILNTCVDYFNQFLNYNDPKTTYQFAVLILPYISLDEDYKNSFISNCLMVLNDVISDAEMICAWLTFFMQNANRETKIKIYEYLVPLFQNTYQNQDLPLLRVLFVFLLDHPNMEYKS